MKIFLSICSTVFWFALTSAVGDDGNFTYPACDSQIYCYGPLLDTVQMAHLYIDSKTFVDQKQKYCPNETLARFNKFMETHNNTPTIEEVGQFVNETFDPVGLEFEDWIPEDWTEDPSFLDYIHDDDLRMFGADINDIWKILGRKLKQGIENDLDRYSIIWVPNPVIVPGGRFREYYYWDSYWIIQGLLLSDMHKTVRGMLENFMYLVNTLGHIPNGGRVYYKARSQVPLLIPMAKLYYEYSKNVTFLREHVATMEKEYHYWLSNHTIWFTHEDEEHLMAVYGDQSYGPRPESYREDKLEAEYFHTDKERQWYYAEKKAGAESGWDYSSRWFIFNGTDKGNLSNIKTRYIVPVDLNSVLEWNARLLAEFYELLQDDNKVWYYKTVSGVFLDSIDAVLWHEETGAWLDYDLLNKKKRDYFYPTNIAPLWTGSYKKEKEEEIVPLVLKYLQLKHVVDPGGIPTTLEHTGEQWDYPNAWPPLVHIVIVGLNNTDNSAAKTLALDIAKMWIRSNYIGYNETETMFEKYDAIHPGSFGSGGEYTQQVGFGWTNGVAIDLLYKYGEVLKLTDNFDVVTDNYDGVSYNDIP